MCIDRCSYTRLATLHIHSIFYTAYFEFAAKDVGKPKTTIGMDFSDIHNFYYYL